MPMCQAPLGPVLVLLHALHERLDTWSCTALMLSAVHHGLSLTHNSLFDTWPPRPELYNALRAATSSCTIALLVHHALQGAAAVTHGLALSQAVSRTNRRLADGDQEHGETAAYMICSTTHRNVEALFDEVRAAILGGERAPAARQRPHKRLLLLR